MEGIGGTLVLALVGIGAFALGAYFLYEGISLIASGNSTHRCNAHVGNCSKRAALFESMGPVGGGLLEIAVGLVMVLLVVAVLWFMFKFRRP